MLARTCAWRNAAWCCSRPSTGQLQPRELAEWIIADKLPVRFQMQLHKLLWDDAAGKLMACAERAACPGAARLCRSTTACECSMMSQNTLRKAVVLVSGGMDSAVTMAMAREQGFRCTRSAWPTVSATTPSWPRPSGWRRCSVPSSTRRSAWICAASAVPHSPPTSMCRWMRRRRRHSGHLRAGAQHHHVVDRAGLGRSARSQRHLVRRQRGGLFRLPRLPPGLHRGIRGLGQRGDQGRVSRVRASACMRR